MYLFLGASNLFLHGCVLKKYTHYRSDVKPEWWDEVIDDDKKG